MLRAFLALILSVGLAATLQAQDQPTDTAATSDARAKTGGATTLEDILARQRGEKVDNSYRTEDTGFGNAAAIQSQLGTRGGASDSEIFRALRYGSADITASARGPAADIIIQDTGMEWLTLRRGPLAQYGAYLLGGMLVVLVLFYLIRGKIRIDGPKTGRKILRFTSIERFGHWLFAGSFLLLAVTGLISLFGRKLIIPYFGHEAFSTMATASKWIHNNVAWAFMVGLVLIFVMWVVHNIPNKHDLKWMAKAGGLFSKHSHPPARKFNAGQKIIFWVCDRAGGLDQPVRAVADVPVRTADVRQDLRHPERSGPAAAGRIRCPARNPDPL